MIHGGPGWSASGWVRCCWRFRWTSAVAATGGGRRRSEADAQRQETLIGEQKAELERLRTEIEVLRSGERLSQQATEQSRQTIKLLEDQVFKQQTGHRVLQGGSRAGQQGGCAGNPGAFEVQGTDDPQRFHIR
ncbi:hypothetical protein ACPA9J_35880 [Pseudomonas aeruginosa]